MRLLDKIDAGFLPLPEFSKGSRRFALGVGRLGAAQPCRSDVVGPPTKCPCTTLVVYPRWAGAQERAFGPLLAAGGGVRAGLAGQRCAGRKTHGLVGSFL